MEEGIYDYESHEEYYDAEVLEAKSAIDSNDTVGVYLILDTVSNLKSLEEFELAQKLLDFSLSESVLRNRLTYVKFFIKHGAKAGHDILILPRAIRTKNEKLIRLIINISRNLERGLLEALRRKEERIAKIIIETLLERTSKYNVRDLFLPLLKAKDPIDDFKFCFEICESYFKLGGFALKSLLVNLCQSNSVEHLRFLGEKGYLKDVNKFRLIDLFWGYLSTISYKTMMCLTEFGLEVNKNNGELLRFFCYSNLDAVRCLIDNGADYHIARDYPFRKALENGSEDIAEYLYDKGLKKSNIQFIESYMNKCGRCMSEKWKIKLNKL